AYFARMAPIVGGTVGEAMTAIAADPRNAQAAATLSTDPDYNALLRTTCVATQVQAGHAAHPLPQRAAATANRRVIEGHPAAADVRAALEGVLDDPEIHVEIAEPGETSTVPPLTRAFLEHVEHAVAHLWPGIPVIPVMSAGATDGRYLSVAGIPTYGVSGRFA